MDHIIPPFELSVFINNRSYIFEVGQTYLSGSKEIYTLMHKDRIIEIQSNRPFIRKDINSKKKIEWKVVNGRAEHHQALELIKNELDSYVKKFEKPPFDWSTHPKNMPY
ncbi:MAG: hypothetical protein M3R50_12870 [Bacteroidota bacterium]|nr:hypothetical protein [Bacteroidota bacterium]